MWWVIWRQVFSSINFKRTGQSWGAYWINGSFCYEVNSVSGWYLGVVESTICVVAICCKISITGTLVIRRSTEYLDNAHVTMATSLHYYQKYILCYAAHCNFSYARCDRGACMHSCRSYKYSVGQNWMEIGNIKQTNKLDCCRPWWNPVWSQTYRRSRMSTTVHKEDH